VRAGLFALLACAALTTLAACADAEGSNRATVAIHFSRFEPDVIVARAGDPLTITLRNDDPIEHEWIVGPDAVHERHRTGTEPFHDERPTEVTVPAFSSKVTTVTFDVPGEYAYVCHLPGHEEYGMKGTLRVIE
jgi:plastocyanin